MLRTSLRITIALWCQRTNISRDGSISLAWEEPTICPVARDSHFSCSRRASQLTRSSCLSMGSLARGKPDNMPLWAQLHALKFSQIPSWILLPGSWTASCPQPQSHQLCFLPTLIILVFIQLDCNFPICTTWVAEHGKWLNLKSLVWGNFGEIFWAWCSWLLQKLCFRGLCSQITLCKGRWLCSRIFRSK